MLLVYLGYNFGKDGIGREVGCVNVTDDVRGDKDDAFDKCLARGVDRATVVIGERNLNLSWQHDPQLSYLCKREGCYGIETRHPP